MSNLSNVTATCFFSDNALKMIDNYNWVSYVGLAPLYFLVGLSGHSLTLMSFWKQSKEKGAYAYQIICCVVEMLEILTISWHTFFVAHLSGFRIKPGNAAFKQSYTIMFITAHIPLPTDQAFITMSLLSSLSMAVDRVFALAKPHVHRDLRHKRHQIASVIICFLISASTSAFDTNRYLLLGQDDHYEVQLDQIFLASSGALTSNYVRISIRMAGLFALIGFNVALVFIFRKQMVETGAISGNEKQKADRKAKEKTLIQMTICQSFFTGLAIVGLLVNHTILYAFPAQANCVGKLVGAISDFNLQMTGMLEFFGLMIISKKFRETVFSSLKCGSRVSPISKNGASNLTALSNGVASHARHA